MAILVDWHSEARTILHQRFIHTWSTSDYFQVIDRTYRLLGSVEHVVDVVVDFTESTSSPSRVLSSISLSSASILETRVHPNQRLVVVLGADSYLKAVFNMWSRILPRAMHNVAYAGNFSEALGMIARYNTGAPIDSEA
jgi:hypothetical protein